MVTLLGVPWGQNRPGGESLFPSEAQGTQLVGTRGPHSRPSALPEAAPTRVFHQPRAMPCTPLPLLGTLCGHSPQFLYVPKGLHSPHMTSSSQLLPALLLPPPPSPASAQPWTLSFPLLPLGSLPMPGAKGLRTSSHPSLLPVITLPEPYQPPPHCSSGSSRVLLCCVCTGNALCWECPSPTSTWLHPTSAYLGSHVPSQGGPTLGSPHQLPATSCLVKYLFYYCPCKGGGAPPTGPGSQQALYLSSP